MKIFRSYQKVCVAVEKAVIVCLMIILSLMTVIAVVEVFRRYIAGLSFPWADEVCRYLMVWLGFLGGALAFRKSKLVRFDLGHDKFSERARTILDIVVCAISLVFLGIVFYYSYNWAFSFSVSKSKMLALPFSLKAVYLAVPTGLGCYLLFLIEKVCLDVFKLKKVPEGADT